MTDIITPKWVLPIIVISQFCCTSLWFAGNAVMGELVINFHLQPSALGNLTSAVQFGFILGTLVFALLSVADRFSPSKVFFFSALAGALFNMTVTYDGNTITTLLILRFFTGFFLAGIYPVGMKIASDYFKDGLGKSLGFLVGALVLGTAFPHLLKGFGTALPWKMVLFVTTGLASLGGIFMLVLVPNGPYRKQSQALDLSAVFSVFKSRPFRAAASGYFGHMWELYTFWAYVPLMLGTYFSKQSVDNVSIPLLSFSIIGVGGISCVIAGYVSSRVGVKKTATIALLLSCFCCLLSPVFFEIGSAPIFILFLVFWGMAVIADSPLFSTLVAQNAPSESKGTALTIVNSIGFAITILSIQLISMLSELINPQYIYLVLAFGPVLGLLALIRK
ncbi:MAG: MFS transporter [Cyclobacteriaceae bacterium]